MSSHGDRGPKDTEPEEEPMRRRTDSRWTALYVLCAGMLMIVLDATIVNVALPSIQSDLHFNQSTLAWVVNGYLITFGGLLLLAGRFGDLVGRRRMFLIGLAVFTTASAACGLAQSQAMLVTARFIQGAGGAMTSAVILGMIVTMFREPREQAKAIGVYAFVASAGGSIGLLVGGVLTQAINWHWIFFVNLPIGVVTGALARRLLDDDQGIGLAQGADVAGAALITAALMLGVYAIVTKTPVLAPVAVALLVAFVGREATARSPLVPLRIFRSRNVSGANLIQALTVAGMFGVFFLGALYLRKAFNYDALEIGLAFVPATLLMGGLSLGFTERLVTRFGATATLRPGLVMIAAGMLWFSRVPVHGSYVSDVLPTMILIGAGCGICFPSLMTVAMSGATPSDAGLASGLVNTTMQVGGALGLAVLASVGGYQTAFLIGAGLVLVAIVAAYAMLQTKTRPAAEPQAEYAPSRA
jgi:EmrB/QacA subfamily drug resistance transporter